MKALPEKRLQGLEMQALEQQGLEQRAHEPRYHLVWVEPDDSPAAIAALIEEARNRLIAEGRSSPNDRFVTLSWKA
jgi:hypothetical protein